ncbi:hypothetical protein [Neorhizobium sp. DAR64860/K0K1]|uniref:hypothetical protein n=1 Tax=Neorhizobium sp. DAR64860/K0K1 TaxID=3421955 RepID=UPI003D272E98
MKRTWPEEFDFILDGAEEVSLEVPVARKGDVSQGETVTRHALKVRLTQQDYERVWPLAETRYRLGGSRTGKAITLIANNPHYQQWHPADGGSDAGDAEGGRSYATRYVVVFFLLDVVRETADA